MSEDISDTIDLRSILSTMRRQLRLIALTIVLTFGLIITFLTTETKLYTATALVRYDPAQRSLLDAGSRENTSSQTESARIESEIEILRSDATVLAVISQAGLMADPEFGPQIGNVEKLKRLVGLAAVETASGDALLKSALLRVRGATTIRRRGLSYLISVSYQSNDPKRAAELANAYARAYIDRQVAAKVASSLAASDVLQAQMDAAQKKLAASEDALDTYIDSNLDRLAAESGVDVSDLQAELVAARRNTDRILGQVSSASDALVRQDWASLSTELGDEGLRALEKQRQDLRRRMGELGANTSEAIDLKAELAKLDESLELRATTAISSLESEASSLSAAAAAANDKLRERILGSNLSSQTLTDLYSQQQEAAISRRQYQALLERSRDLEAQSLLQIADSWIESEALPPFSASYPNSKLVIAMGGLFALGLGMGLAMLNEYFIGGVVSASQLANLISARVGTTFPEVKRTNESNSVADAVVTNPLSNYAESARRLQAAIDQALHRANLRAKNAGEVQKTGGRGKIILVTSAIPADGKSTVALALARTYALAGRKTLLIDGDLRKPSLHRNLGLMPESGFLDFLIDPSNPHHANNFYDRDQLSGAEVILGSSRANVPTDQLLNSETFENLLEEARETMDVTVIDSSPLVPVVDAQYIAPHVDVAVLVVRSSVTSQREVRAAYADLREVLRQEAEVFSVLNQEVATKTSYRYEGYYNNADEDQD